MRTRPSALAALAAVAALAVPAPALAAVPFRATAALTDYDPAEADRFFVRWLSTEDERLAVRSAARGALLAGTGDTAVQDFLTTGWDTAISRAAQTHARNTDFATRMVATHAVAYYPWVNAAGRHALAGTEAQLQEFVSTGYAKALDLDRRAIAYDNGQAQLVRQDDRDFVTRLGLDDPGPQVRAWAARAVGPGTTDADVVEFFRYGWVSASGLDLQMFHTRLADDDRRWRLTAQRLVAEAQAAEKAARETAGEAQAQLRAAAARAWADVGDRTGPARVAWADAEQTALHQAETWLLVSQTAAAATTSTNWTTIAGTAPAARADWLAEQQTASTQASTWTALYERARAAEAALSEPTS
jgi:hypothetical protein